MTTKKGATNLFKTIVISAVTVMAVTVTFLHDSQPASSPEYLQHKKTYKQIITTRDSDFEALLVGLETRELSVSEYIMKLRTSKEFHSNQLKIYNKRKREIKVSDSVIGYTSYKNFLLGIAFPICGFLMSLTFLFVVVRNIHSKMKKRYYLMVLFVYTACWGYWVAWSFLSFSIDPNRPFDFPKGWYNVARYVLPSLIFIGAYFLFTHYRTIEQKLRKNISDLIHTLLNISPDDRKNEMYEALEKATDE